MLRDFSRERFDIVLQAGQSNADHSGYGKTDRPFFPCGDIWYLTKDLTIVPAVEWINGNQIESNFSLSFAENYLRSGKLSPGRKVLILRAAVGGTGFLDHRWGPEDDLFLQMLRMIETARSLNPENRFVAFIWHQGETDALLNADFQTHYDHLHTLVTLTRNAMGDPTVPFLAADFVHDWIKDNRSISEPVRSAIRSVCEALPHAGFVETDGLRSNNQDCGNLDTIHFCRDALYYLGDRYFEQYQRLTSTT